MTALTACVTTARSVPLWASNTARACAACRRDGSAGEDTAAGAEEDTTEGAGEDVGAPPGDTCPAGPLHVWPFHRRISVPPPEPTPVLPTTQAVPAAAAAMPWRLASGPSPVGTVVQAVPFQCMVSGRLLLSLIVTPIAQALSAEAAATVVRMLPAGLGLGTVVQAVPFHRRISVPLLLVPQLMQPTAQAPPAGVVATP